MGAYFTKSERGLQLNMANYPNFKQRIFATDLDNTIVSEEVSHRTLWDALDLEKTSLIYITGRHKNSAVELINREQLPQPDVLVCDVGASIYVGETFELDQKWAEQIDVEEYKRIESIASSLNIERQPIKTSWRLAFYANEQEMRKLEEKIREENINVDLVYSSGRDLDVLYRGINKGAALTYILNETQYNGDIIVAGDSENDVSLFQLGLPAIAVGNACEAIRNMEANAHIHYANGHAAEGVKEGWALHFNEKK